MGAESLLTRGDSALEPTLQKFHIILGRLQLLKELSEMYRPFKAVLYCRGWAILGSKRLDSRIDRYLDSEIERLY